MRKYVFTALLSLLIAVLLGITASAEVYNPQLFDGADLLTPSEENVLLSKLEAVSQKYGVQFVIATVNDTGVYSVDQYVEYYYDNGGYGYGDRRDGVLLLVSMADRDYRILANGLGADALSYEDIDYIGEAITPYLSDGEYADAFDTFIDECEYEVNGQINGFPFEFGTNLLIALVVGFGAAFIVTAVMRGQLKSVRAQTNATSYMKSGSMKLTNSRDIYLYRTVSKIRRETSSGSGSRSGIGGGGGGRHVGGGKF